MHEDHGPVRYGPPAPDPGLPVIPELAAVLAAAADRTRPEPPGGGRGLREAACAYWARRGLHGGPENIVAAPGDQPLLLALIAAHGGDVLMPRPCPATWMPQARLLGTPAYQVPTPAECGGVPDPYALLETVRRVRAEGGRPKLLVLSVADDPTATVAPPELVREACEAAVGEGMHIISDETWRDTVHRPRDTVLLSPAEMCPDDVTVISDLSGGLTPAAWPVAVARFPETGRGAVRRARTLDVLTALGALVAGPLAPAAAHALGEPEAVRERIRRAAGLQSQVAAAAHRAVLTAGVLARPRRPAATSTRTSARSAPGWRTWVSRTPWSWRSTSPTGSAPRPRAATASGTSWAPCAYGSVPGRCWGRRPRNSGSPSPPRSPWSCRTWRGH